MYTEQCMQRFVLCCVMFLSMRVYCDYVTHKSFDEQTSIVWDEQDGITKVARRINKTLMKHYRLVSCGEWNERTETRVYVQVGRRSLRVLLFETLTQFENDSFMCLRKDIFVLTFLREKKIKSCFCHFVNFGV